MNICPDCGGTGWITLLTSKAKCAHPSHGATVTQANAAHDSVQRIDCTEMQPGEVISGPGYRAACLEEKFCNQPRGPGLKRVVGQFVCDQAPSDFEFDLSKYLPLIGRGFVIASSSERGGKVGVDFESVGPVHKRIS